MMYDEEPRPEAEPHAESQIGIQKVSEAQKLARRPDGKYVHANMQAQPQER